MSILSENFSPVLDREQMEDWMETMALRDHAGPLEYGDILHISGASDKWELREIPIDWVTWVVTPSPRHHKTWVPPIVLDTGDGGMECLDGKHRLGEAKYRGEKTALCYVGEIFKETKYICAKCGGTSQGPRCSRVVSNQVCGGTCTVQEGLAESDINPAEHQWLVLGQGSPSTNGTHAFDADDVEMPADAVEEADWSYSIMWDREAAALVPLVDTILKGHRCALVFGLNPASSYHMEIGHVAFLVDASPDARQALNELGVHLSPFNGLSKYNDVKVSTFREFDYPGMAALEKLTVSRQGMLDAGPRYHRPKEGETSGDYWARKIEIAKAQQQIKQPRVGESILDEADIAPSVDLDGINAEIEVLTAKYRATLNTNIYLSPKAVRDYPATLVLHTLNARRDAPRGTGTAFMTDLCALADRHGLMITLEAGEQRGSTGFKNTTSINRLRAFYARFGFQRNSGKRNYRPDLSGTMHRHARKLGEAFGNLDFMNGLCAEFAEALRLTLGYTTGAVVLDFHDGDFHELLHAVGYPAGNDTTVYDVRGPHALNAVMGAYKAYARDEQAKRPKAELKWLPVVSTEEMSDMRNEDLIGDYVAKAVAMIHASPEKWGKTVEGIGAPKTQGTIKASALRPGDHVVINGVPKEVRGVRDEGFRFFIDFADGPLEIDPDAIVQLAVKRAYVRAQTDAPLFAEDFETSGQWGLGVVHADNRVSYWPCSEGQFFGIEHQQALERGYLAFAQGDAKWRYKMGYIAWTSYPNPEEKIAVEDYCIKHGLEVKGHTTYVDNYDMATQKAAADSARYRRTFDQRRGVPSYAGKSEARERHIILGTSMKENDGKPQEPTNYPPGAHSNVRMVAYDALPRETQEDIAGWIAERAEIQALEGGVLDNWGSHAPGVPFHPFDLHDQLHGLVDPLMLAVRDLPVAAITDFRRNPDARIYAGKFQRGEVPPPILVDGTKFVDGGHRLAAALAAGTATIPTVDMWPLLSQDWAAWLRDETNTTHPIKGGMYERPEAREARLKSFEAELGLKYGLTKSYLTSPDPVPFDKEKLTVAERHKWQKLQTKDWLNPNGEFHKLVEMAWPADFPSVILHTNVITMKSHVDYTAAKAGGIRAAKRVVETLAKPDKLRNIVHQHPDAVFLPVLAMEASGKNMLPLALAEKLSEATGLGVETDIIQINKTFHTNSSGAHRLASIARFDGQAAQPTSYVLVDDVVTSGGTLAAMRQHVEESGGRVVAITALAAAAYANVVAISAGTLQRLYAKFPGAELDILLKELKIAPDRTDLTNSQANYVLKFLTVDALRRALEKA